MTDRARALAQTVLAAAALALAVLTALVPDWIEACTGLDPDGGDGAVEWGAVVVLTAAALAAAVAAGRSWRRWATASG